jgi:hypothetical protein
MFGKVGSYGTSSVGRLTPKVMSSDLGSVGFRSYSGKAIGWMILVSALVASPSSAGFLGMDSGDVIDSVGWTVASGGGVFTDNVGVGSDLYDVSGTATDITTTAGSPGGATVLTEIGGGSVGLHLDLASESLIRVTSNPFSLYSYSATLTGRAGVNDITLTAPTGAGEGENGQDLMIGEVMGSVTIGVGFFVNAGTGALLPTGMSFTATGIFEVTGGDGTFLQVFGEYGDLADLILTSTSTLPSILTLMSDGHLMSNRSQDFLDCTVGGGNCSAAISDENADFTFSATGAIEPQASQAFNPIPEPASGLLVTFGLVALGVARRQR